MEPTRKPEPTLADILKAREELWWEGLIAAQSPIEEYINRLRAWMAEEEKRGEED